MTALSLLTEQGEETRRPLFAVRVVDEPRPKQRPRIVRFGRNMSGQIRTYTPSETEAATHKIRQAFVEKYDPGSGFQPYAGAVCLRFTAWLKMPTSTPKKYQETALPAKKPDLPNLGMLMADALSGYAYVDDGMITDAQWRKRYAGTYGGPSYPCWEVEIFADRGD